MDNNNNHYYASIITRVKLHLPKVAANIECNTVTKE